MHALLSKHEPPKSWLGVNHLSPQAQGLLYWWDGGYGQLGEKTVFRERLRNKHGSTQNPSADTAQVVASTWGPCWDSLNDNNNGGVWVGENLLFGRSAFSICQWVKGVAHDSGKWGLCSSWSTGSRSILIRGSMQYFLYVSSGQIGGYRGQAAVDAYDSSRWNLIVATYDGATSRFFVNGVAGTTANGTGTVGEADSGQLNWCGNYNSLSGQQMNGLVRDCRIYSHALEIGEVRRIYRDPFDLWRRPRFIPLASATAAYTLTAESGTLALSGQSAGLTAQRQLAAAAGTLALSGQDAGLLSGVALAAEAGTLGLTGQDAGLTAQRVLTSENGTLTLTGIDAGLSTSGFTLVAEAGTLTLSGQTAGLAAAQTMTADAGTLTLSGQDATLVSGIVMTADAGTLGLSGQSAGLLHAAVLACTSGTLTLTGQDVALNYSEAVFVASLHWTSRPNLAHWTSRPNLAHWTSEDD